MPTMITVAPTGAEVRKADVASLPVTLDELVTEAVACEAAGAAMVHVHVRDATGAPTLDLSVLRDTVAALREATSLVVQLSTGGSVRDGFDARLRVLEADPDACSLTMGTTNFGDDVFLNPWPFVVELYEGTCERGVVPEFELFDLGQVHALSRLLAEHGLPAGGRVHADLVLGVPGGASGTASTVAAMVAALPDAVTSWSATGIGRSHLPVLAAALASGGHLRVGMEDNVFFARGQLVTSNAELVARAALLATHLQVPPMTTSGARDLLGVPAAGRASAGR